MKKTIIVSFFVAIALFAQNLYCIVLKRYYLISPIYQQNKSKNYPNWPAPVDSDHGGMPDAWEKKFNLRRNDASDGAKDADKDGYTDATEWLNDTDPTIFVDYASPATTQARCIEFLPARPLK